MAQDQSEGKCIICGCPDLRAFRHLSREGKTLDLFECKRCGHVFQDPASHKDIYSTGEFSEMARTSKTPTPEKIKSLDKSALARFHFYRKHLDDWQEVLEIGSSIGSFLHVLRMNGKSVHGIEPDPVFAAFSQAQYRLDQEAITIEEFSPDQQYDAICSFHVIEHVQDPKIFVQKAGTILKEGGKILIECPSYEIHYFGDMEATIWEPHVHYFNTASMYWLLAKNGFKVLEQSFYGPALYIYAEKTGKDEFKESAFKSKKRLAGRVKREVKLFPEIPLKYNPNTSVKKLVLQHLIQRNKKESLTKSWEMGTFALQNLNYLRKERKGRGEEMVHLSYFNGWENAGDTVLSKCVRDTVNPGGAWQLKKVTDPVTDSFIEAANKTRAIILGGGGLLLPDSNPNTISGWQWAVSEKQLLAIKVPLVVFAIGYNYFPGQTPNDHFIKNLKLLIEKASFFSLRNHGSIQMVNQLTDGKYEDKIVWQPCPTTIIRQLNPKLREKKSSKNVAVNIAFDRYEKRFGKDMYLILDNIAKGLKALEEKGYTIHTANHLLNDGKFELVLDKYQVNYKSVNLQYALPQQVYHFFNNMELVYGMRGHAQMIPYGVNAPIISLGSHNKLRYFLEDIDATDWFIELRDNPQGIAEAMVGKFEAIVEQNRSEVDVKLRESQQELFKVTRQNLEIIQKII